MSRSAVKRALAALKASGLVEIVTKGHGKRANVYRVKGSASGPLKGPHADRGRSASGPLKGPHANPSSYQEPIKNPRGVYLGTWEEMHSHAKRHSLTPTQMPYVLMAGTEDHAGRPMWQIPRGMRR